MQIAMLNLISTVKPIHFEELVGSGSINGGQSFREDFPYVAYSLYPPILPLVFIKALVNTSNKKTVGAPIINAAPKMYPIKNSGNV